MLIMLPKYTCLQCLTGLKEAYPQLGFNWAIKLPAANDLAERQVELLGFLGTDREGREDSSIRMV